MGSRWDLSRTAGAGSMHPVGTKSAVDRQPAQGDKDLRQIALLDVPR